MEFQLMACEQAFISAATRVSHPRVKWAYKRSMRDPALKMRAGDAKVLEYSAFAYNGDIIIGEKW